MRFEEVCGTPCDLSGKTLEAAACKLGPSFVYDLHIHPHNVVWVRNLVRHVMADVKENPLAPYINIIEDQEMLPRYAWCLAAGGKAFGSMAPG